MKDDFYYLEQTPVELAKELINQTPFDNADTVYEPFKGEGAFYNNFPETCIKVYTEIEEGLDYKNYSQPYDWVVTNFPFRIYDEKKDKMVNSVAHFLEYFSKRARKGMGFLVNDKCFSALTTKRLQDLQNDGWYIHKIIVCAVKKWRGRYFYIIFQKKPCEFYKHLITNY